MGRDRALEVPAAHRPRFHFTAPSGWLNDSNGLCFHDGRYHLHYQHNPHAPRWGDIHWGHGSSADLLYWRDEPIALAPSPGFDADGCFSGSFALVGSVPTLYYTGNAAGQQTQCIATSADLQRWAEHPERPLVMPPAGVYRTDFRDPYVFRHERAWYMVVGASLRSERGLCLLVIERARLDQREDPPPGRARPARARRRRALAPARAARRERARGLRQ